VPPQGEAWSNLKLAQSLAARMGVTDPVFRMSQSEILRELFRGAKGALAAFDPDTLRDAGPISIATKGEQQFRTPSGRLEFYSDALAAQGLPPMPDWQPDPVEATQGAQWPLRLLTGPGYFQSHTAFSGVSMLRDREGKPYCVLHPTDAAARNLREGEHVRLVNDRGAVGLTLHVRDEIQPGVVLVPGQRPDQEAVSGTVNMLCSDAFTDMGEGATYQSTWLDVRAW
jgi:anaerobic selenocysteine-containing dehydrogenase